MEITAAAGTSSVIACGDATFPKREGKGACGRGECGAIWGSLPTEWRVERRGKDHGGGRKVINKTVPASVEEID